MNFLKDQSIEEKAAGKALFGWIGEALQESVNCKWYVCPKCKMIELSIDMTSQEHIFHLVKIMILIHLLKR
jgi:hypothetical protein